MLGKIVLRNSALVALDQGIGVVVTLGSAGIVARKLGPEKMGHYGFAMWLTLTMTAFGAHSVGAVLRKYIAEYMGRGDVAMAKAITRAAFFIQLCSGAAVVVISMTYVLWRVHPGHQLYNALALLSTVPVLLLTVPTAVNAAAEDFRANVIPGIVSTLIQPLGIFFALVLHWELVGLAAGLLLARLADMSLRYYFFRNRFPADTPKLEIPAELRQRMWRYCWQSTMLLVLDLIIWERCEVFFLEKFSDIKQVAFYTSSFSLSMILMTLPTSFAWAAGTTMMVQKGRDPDSLNRMTTLSVRFLALMVFPLTLGMAALSGPAVRVIFGYRYLPAIPVIALMAVMSIPKGLFSPAQALMMAQDRQGFLVKWEIAAAAFTIALDWSLIPDHAAVGAAWGNGIAQLVAVVGIWFYAIHTEHLKLPWRELSLIFLSALIMAAVAYACAAFLPPLAAVLVGVPAGAATYILLLRLMRSFHPDDHQRLMNLESQMPAPLRPSYNRIVEWVMQPVAGQSPAAAAVAGLPPEP